MRCSEISRKLFDFIAVFVVKCFWKQSSLEKKSAFSNEYHLFDKSDGQVMAKIHRYMTEGIMINCV